MRIFFANVIPIRIKAHSTPVPLPAARSLLACCHHAFTVGKHHLYFAAYKKHIGFYPVYGLPEIEEQITPYRAKGTKDSLHFPRNKPLPVELIKEIIRLKERKG